MRSAGVERLRSGYAKTGHYPDATEGKVQKGLHRTATRFGQFSAPMTLFSRKHEVH